MNGLLVLTAHPDDESLIAGGVLAACAAAGAPTGVVCLTRGEHGPLADPALATRETLGGVRLAELRAACAELGVSHVTCYRRADAHLPWTNTRAVARQLARAIEAQRPAAIVTFGPDGLYDHPDHVAVGDLARRALVLLPRAGRPGEHPSLYESVWPQATMPELVRAMAARGLPSDLWGIEPEAFGVAVAGSMAVDVRPFVARKLRALRCHRSQLGATHLFSALPDDLAERFLGWERFRRVRPGGARADRLTELVREAGAEVVDG